MYNTHNCVYVFRIAMRTRRYLLFDMLMTLMDYYGDGPGAVNDRVFAELKAELRAQMRHQGLLKSTGAGEPTGSELGLAHIGWQGGTYMRGVQGRPAVCDLNTAVGESSGKTPTAELLAQVMPMGLIAALLPCCCACRAAAAGRDWRALLGVWGGGGRGGAAAEVRQVPHRTLL